MQFVLKLVEQFEWVASFAVHFVDVDDYGGVTHTADRHQLACLRLYALCTVDYNDYAVYSCKGAESIFGKVLVTGGVEDVYLVSFIIELHH